jgi:hypothetical protein
MNLSDSALNKLWQDQKKAAPQQTLKHSGGKQADSKSDQNMSFETSSIAVSTGPFLPASVPEIQLVIKRRR